jgi:DNA-binding XRE family transcriptional regulator
LSHEIALLRHVDPVRVDLSLRVIAAYRLDQPIGLATLASLHWLSERRGVQRALSRAGDPFPELREQWMESLCVMARATHVSGNGAALLGSTLGQRVVELRLRAGLTQEDLARRLGVSTTALREWEHDRALPLVARYAAICRVLHCTRHELVDGN